MTASDGGAAVSDGIPALPSKLRVPYVQGAVVEAGGDCREASRQKAPGRPIAQRTVLALRRTRAVALQHPTVADDGKAVLHAGS